MGLDEGGDGGGRHYARAMWHNPPPVPQKLHIKTFGCQMNEYDSARMAGLLADSCGLAVTDCAEEADVLLLNTCSVREKAQEKVFSQLGRWREWKLARPSLVIGVGGCVASQEGEQILARAPFVDLVFGPQTYHRLPQMLKTARATRRASVDVSFPEIEKFDCLPPPRVDGARAFVSIMEGCSKYCTFCVVPYTRGEEFSRPFDDVITEIVDLAAQGVREVTLLGQNVNGYRGATAAGGVMDFGTLLYYVAEVDGIERIRYTTSHPADFNDTLVRAYADLPQLASHLHLPVQSGSDRILFLMKRRYSVERYREIISAVRANRPGLSLTSDFIVGFPGESEDDFAATLNLVDELQFDQSFSFLYSPRPGTPAAQLPDEVPAAVKKERLARLQEKLSANALDFNRALVGASQRVLVDGVSSRDRRRLCGRTTHNKVVNFAGPPFLSGRFVGVTVTEARPNSLLGALTVAEVATTVSAA